MKILDLPNPRSRAVASAMLLFPLLSFAAWYVLTMQREQDDFPVILKQYGYSAMALPSRLFGPGTIMTVETLRSARAVRARAWQRFTIAMSPSYLASLYEWC